MTATVGGWVWVDGLNEKQRGNLRRALTVYPRKTTDIATAKTPDPIELFRERSDGTFGVPRSYWLKMKSDQHHEVLAVSTAPDMGNLKSMWSADPPFEEQAMIASTLVGKMKGSPYWGGILEADCAVGKSFVSTEIAHRIGKKTIILVEKEFLLNQWRECIQEVLPEARVGIIQENKCEWKDVDFSIAMLQSLRNDADGRKYPQEMYDGFGMLISDEVHHVSSESFSDVIPRFSAPIRLGLSATLKRAAEDENVFWYHIGPVAYRAKSKSMPLNLRVVRTAAKIEPIRRGWDRVNKRWKYEVKESRMNSAQVLSQLAGNASRSEIIIDEIVLAAKSKRKILVVSERLEQLRVIGEGVRRKAPGVTVGHYTGQWFGEKAGKMKTVKADEKEYATTCQVMLATKQIVSEGFSLPPLDTIILAVPFGDVRQMLGRVQRWCKPKSADKCAKWCPWRHIGCQGKPDPIVVDVFDPYVGKSIGKWRRRINLYHSMEIDVPVR